jgi:uncharacterized protein YkwD
MKPVIFLALLLALAACNTVSPLPLTNAEPPQLPDSSTTEPTVTNELQTLLTLVNEVRGQGYDCATSKDNEKTVPLLTLQSILNNVALKHSLDLEASGTTTQMHVTPEGARHYQAGTTFIERVEAEGYKWAAVGENVAYNFVTPKQVIEAWLESPEHCKNIMNPKYSELGLGKAGDYWTQVFAAPL